MDREHRIRKLDRIRKGTPLSSMEVRYKDDQHVMNVFAIPLNHLVYNQYNGRISSKVKSYETQHSEIDASTSAGRARIANFLWHSNVGRNKKTLRDLEKHTQLKPGIVTRDGIIIDGNRRACLLEKIAEKRNSLPGHFKAVILDDTLEDSAREIKRLETIYQMGEDEKLTYNAIEKYLKCKDLEAEGFNSKEIAEMMSESEERIKTMQRTMVLMDEYLAHLGYEGIYTRLDETEGPFVDLERYLNQYDVDGGSKYVDWMYDDADLHDLKLIMFDWIRGRFGGESKLYRTIGKPSKKDSIFCRGDLWSEFRDRHFDLVDEATSAEPAVDDLRRKSPGAELETLLAHRDKDWAAAVEGPMKGNLNRSQRKLEDLNEKNAPLKLLERAYATLQNVDCEQPTFYSDANVKAVVQDINSIIWQFKKVLDRHKTSDA